MISEKDHAGEDDDDFANGSEEYILSTSSAHRAYHELGATISIFQMRKCYLEFAQLLSVGAGI